MPPCHHSIPSADGKSGVMEVMWMPESGRCAIRVVALTIDEASQVAGPRETFFEMSGEEFDRLRRVMAAWPRFR